jgi:hypothetical protein
MKEKTDLITFIFETNKKTNEFGSEYWLARDLQSALGYSRWGLFKKVIAKAQLTCINTGQDIEDHFQQTIHNVVSRSGTQKEIDEIELSRFALYLIVQNGDPANDAIAQCQTYLASQTYNQETHSAKALKPSEGMMDHFDSTEFAAYLFCATQTEAKLHRENIQGKDAEDQIYFEVGKKVRQAIQDLGGELPEDLPALEESNERIAYKKGKELKPGE